MVIKMASIVTTHIGWEHGKEILDTHYMLSGGDSRYAGEASVVDEQIEGALQRILYGSESDEYKAARQFYCSLIDLRFCKVKNGALKIFMQYLLKM
ncbi:unnamed protein product [Gongylonema pulchrum]|uniref:DUF1028 domain-containing protein n=1 Tax=Gongylonema pulchrum TaxID=637853 RepID=A0A183ECU5_9BILA|nr:unnamed protein product [Gongylonema pulchrum]